MEKSTKRGLVLGKIKIMIDNDDERRRKERFFREEEKQNTREDARIGSRFSKRRQIER